jgi:hypothetical protein
VSKPVATLYSALTNVNRHVLPQLMRSEFPGFGEKHSQLRLIDKPFADPHSRPNLGSRSDYDDSGPYPFFGVGEGSATTRP